MSSRFCSVDRLKTARLDFESRGSANYFADAVRNIVQAAAENTNTFATMTGDAFISTP